MVAGNRKHRVQCWPVTVAPAYITLLSAIHCYSMGTHMKDGMIFCVK